MVLGKKISWGIFLLSFICFHAICREDGVKCSLKDTNFLSNLIISLESSKLLLLWLCTVFQRKVQNILFLIEKCFTFLRPNGGCHIENILCTRLSVQRHIYNLQEELSYNFIVCNRHYFMKKILAERGAWMLKLKSDYVI